MNNLEEAINQLSIANGSQQSLPYSDFFSYAFKKSDQHLMLSQLPGNVRKKIRALRKLQWDTTKLEVDFHKKMYEIEQIFEEKYRKIFNKRQEIVNGQYEPTEEECDYPDFELPVEQISTQSVGSAQNAANQQQNEDQSTKTGIPDFWLNIFKYSPIFEAMLKETDELVLKHLSDISVSTAPLPEMSFTLEFHFTPNEFFSNSILTKTYFLKCSPNPDDPFSFEGPEIYATEGCQINWKDGKDLTIKTVKMKTQKQNDKNMPKIMKTGTFFNFFNPPKLIEDINDPDFEEVRDILQADFEIGHYMKENIVPKAILYFTGEQNDEETDSSTIYTDEDQDDIDSGNELVNVDGEGDIPA